VISNNPIQSKHEKQLMTSHYGMTTSLSLKDIFLCCLLFTLTACKTMPTTPDSTEKIVEENKATENIALPTEKTSTKYSDDIDVTTSATTNDNLTSEEKTQQLDQKLDDRFADFDRLLLREREFLNEKQNEQGSPQSGGGGATADGVDGFKGLDEYGDIAEQGSEPYNNGTATQKSSGENAFPSENTNINIPPDLVNSKGDDVIARQLREAAIKEKDPALREKLWDEYRKYKEGT
jgi:hypothetical protein